MSVLLTSAKRAVRGKPKKRKSYRIPTVPVEQRPPLSNGETSVWFWDLNGTPTTVLFNKYNNQVYCNGFRLETFEGFSEDGDDDDIDLSRPGAIIDFTIFMPETQASYQARIRRLPPRHVQGYSTHTLTVDDWLIPEHVSYDYSSYDHVSSDYSYDQQEGGAYLNSRPLVYDD